jgi:hypothetical protein
MDRDTMITLDDGTEVSLGDLIQSRTDLKDVLTINEDLQKDLDGVGVLFQEGVTWEERESAVRKVLVNLGYENDQIDSYLEATRQAAQPVAEEEPEAEENSAFEVSTDDYSDVEDDVDDSSGGQQEDNMSDEREQILRGELESQRAELHLMRVRELRENLNANLDRVLKSNPDFQKLIESARQNRGEEGVTQATATLRSQLEQRSLERMQARRTSAGNFQDSWMSEEVDKAVEPLMGTFRSVIGDIDRLGRSSETVTGLDAQEILRSKPVSAPEWTPGATISDIESQVKSFASDSIKRALAASPGDSAI